MTFFSSLQTNFHFNMHTIRTITWPVFGVVFLLYFIMTLILMYHWRQYGMKSRLTSFAEIVYFIGSAAIFIVAFVALLLL